MAPNFEIAVLRKRDNLHLRLMGDFDRSSVHQLLNILRENCLGTSRIFINTTCLKNIYPFDLDVFHKNLELLGEETIPLVFTGLNAAKMVRPNSV